MTKTIQKLPALEGGARVESGVVQFGEDWPGVFFRGDNAAYIASTLAAFVSTKIENGDVSRGDFMLCGFLLGHADDLAAADLSGTVGPGIKSVRERLMRLAALADDPAAGGVQ